MSLEAIQALIGAALLDREFCERLLGERSPALLAELGLTEEESGVVCATQADSIKELALRVYQQLTTSD
jgi:hypothetical protein